VQETSAVFSFLTASGGITADDDKSGQFRTGGITAKFMSKPSLISLDEVLMLEYQCNLVLTGQSREIDQ
jgi:hypothetical protein